MKKTHSFLLWFILLTAFPVFFSSQALALCGDFTCDSTENKCTCPRDCGSCSGAVPGQLCSNYDCDPSGTVCQVITRHPCCGNNECEIGENFANCPVDCAPKLITITMIEYDESKRYLRGDDVAIRARVTGDGALARKSNVSVTGFFGQLILYDDGNHSDGKADDAVYGNSINIGRYVEKKDYDLVVSAEKLGAVGTKQIKLIIDPSLEMPVILSNDKILLGDIFLVSGNIKRRGIPLAQEVLFSAADDNSVLIPGFSQKVNSDANGNFVLDYHTSLIEPIGEWALKVESTDQFGNKGIFEKKIRVASAAKADFLDLEFLVPSPSIESIFERGEEIKILAGLRFEGKDLEEAAMKATINEASIDLIEFIPGKYSGKYKIPFDSPLGSIQISAVAFKEINKTRYSGSATTRVLIKEAPIRIDVIEPTINVFAIGETITIVVSLSYPSNTPVTGIDINAVTSGGRRISFKEARPGIYEGRLPVLSQDKVGLSLTLIAVDGFKNRGTREMPFEILETKSLFFYFMADPVLVLLLVLIVIVLLGVFVFIFRLRRRIGALEKRRDELLRLREELQQNYFSFGTIDRKEYYSLMSQYMEELEKINATIDSIKLGKKSRLEKQAAAEKQKKSTLLEQEAEDEPMELFKVVPAEAAKPEKKKGLFSFLEKTGGKK